MIARATNVRNVIIKRICAEDSVEKKDLTNNRAILRSGKNEKASTKKRFSLFLLKLEKLSNKVFKFIA